MVFTDQIKATNNLPTEICTRYIPIWHRAATLKKFTLEIAEFGQLAKNVPFENLWYVQSDA